MRGSKNYYKSVLGPYLDTIRALYNILKKKFDDQEAKILAIPLVLGSEYGAGDGLAGFILEHFTGDYIEEFFKILREKGIWKTKRKVTRWGFKLEVLSILRKADFGDEEINNALRELHRVSVSGGRYTPSFLKKATEKSGGEK